jgi:hypothetical protein
MKKWWIILLTLFALPAAAQVRVVATFTRPGGHREADWRSACTGELTCPSAG